MTRLKKSLDKLASRGRPRGANEVFAGATSGADATAGPVRAQRQPLVVFAGVFAGVLLVGALVASLLPGGPLSPSDRGPQVVSQDGAILLVGSPSNGGDDALIYGQLIVGEGGCLAMSWAEGGTYPLVFPAGSQLVPGTQVPTVSVPGSGNIAVGQWVIGGGGYHSTPIVSSGVPEIPPDCAAPGTEVAVAWTIRPEPTTTTAPEMSTLPPSSATPVTVPQGAELSWYDFINGTVQLAWRSTADGTEMCWRTVVAEDCVDDSFRAPDVVVIPGPFQQPIVLTRPPLTGTVPERIVLELSDGTTMDAAPLYPGQGVGILWALAHRLPQGVSVVGARTADWPSISCQTPPSSALDVSGSAFDIRVTSGAVRAGEVIELFIARSRQDNLTGIATTWQCWDGSDWMATHVGTKGWRDSASEPQVFRIESSPAFGLPGIVVPDTFRILVPDLPPGTYRIEDYVGTELGWVIVRIED